MKLATPPANSSFAKPSRGPRTAVKGFLLLLLLLVPIVACLHVRVASALAPAAAKAPIPAIPATEPPAAPQAAPAAVPADLTATAAPAPVALPAALPELTAQAPSADPVAPVVVPTLPVWETLEVPGLSPRVFAMALDAVSRAHGRGASGRDDLLTVIDYSLPSTE